MIERIEETNILGFNINPDYVIHFAWDGIDQKVTFDWVAHRKLNTKQITKRKMSKVLRAAMAKGYDIQYVYYPGLMEFRVWQGIHDD